MSISQPTKVNSYGPALTGTAVSLANPAVVTSTDTGNLQTGDKVLLQACAGMPQIAGLLCQVTVTSPTTFQLNGLDTSAFAAPATAVTFRKLLVPPYWQPQSYQIVSITQASNATITTNQDHNYVPGQLIYVSIPRMCGMSQFNGQTCTIKSVTANTMTVDANTTNFAAFAFPPPTLPAYDFATLASFGVNSSLVLNPYRNTL